jgi:hypothetical protein
MTAAGGITTSQATVDTTSGGVQIVAARPGRHKLTLVNLGTVDVWIGQKGLTSSTGALLVGTKGATLEVDTQDAVYGIVGSGSQAVAAIETY